MSADDIAAQLAFALYQSCHRVRARFTPQTCEALLFTIAKRADTPEKVHRFQALATLAQLVEKEANEPLHPQAATVAHFWAMAAQVGSQAVWRTLHGEIPMPAPDEDAVLADFMDDAELMGILGLQAGWTPDLKRIEPDLDLKATDQGGLS